MRSNNNTRDGAQKSRGREETITDNHQRNFINSKSITKKRYPLSGLVVNVPSPVNDELSSSIPGTSCPSLIGNDKKVIANFHSTVTKRISSSSDDSSDDDDGVWVGIGCGEALTLKTSVYPNSPLDSYLGQHSKRSHCLPQANAFDFQKIESDDLPRVDEDRITRIDSDIVQRKSVLEIMASGSVAELSTDLSIIENSIASLVTKEDCIDLAKRFGKMEQILMERTGETSRSDALRALSQATHKQSKRADLLQKKVDIQKKKNDELNRRCHALMEDITKNKQLQSEMKMQLNEVNRKNAGLRIELHQHKAQNKELKCKNDVLLEKVRVLEEGSISKSRLPSLVNSQKKTDSTRLQDENNVACTESTGCTDTDKAIIDKLNSDLVRMRESHAMTVKRNERKIEILMEIRSALEAQISLFEEGVDMQQQKNDL